MLPSDLNKKALTQMTSGVHAVLLWHVYIRADSLPGFLLGLTLLYSIGKTF